MYRTTPPVIHLKDYSPPEFLIDQVNLRFDLDLDKTLVEAELSLRRNPAATRGNGDLRLDGEQLQLIEVALDGRVMPPAEYQVQDDALIVHRVPDRFQLRTRVRIEPKANTALEGLYVSGDMLCTQCEAEGFRRITYFLDRPDVMARYRITLVADRARYPVLLSNGNPAGSEDLPDGRRLVRWDDPLPEAELSVRPGRRRPGGGRGQLHHRVRVARSRCTSSSSRRTWTSATTPCARSSTRCAGTRSGIGREYDLDIFMIVAVSHFNMGAMENKGLNVFNAKYVLARPDTATDADFAGIEGVVAHEYFHNWTGNRVTCRDWFQLSLKEGFTVFRDQEFSADMGSRGVKRIEDVRMLRARQFPEDAGPMAHPVRPDSYIEINNFYTATVYEKGAEVVRMQAHLLGPERFRAGTDLYFERHRRSGRHHRRLRRLHGRGRRSGSDPVPPLVWPGRHAGAGVHRSLRRRGRHLYAGDPPAHASHSGPAGQAAAAYPARARAVGCRGPRPAAAARWRDRESAAWNTRAGPARVAGTLHVRRSGASAGAFVAARVFGAGQGALPVLGGGPDLLDGARQRWLQPLGCRPESGPASAAGAWSKTRPCRCRMPSSTPSAGP